MLSRVPLDIVARKFTATICHMVSTVRCHSVGASLSLCIILFILLSAICQSAPQDRYADLPRGIGPERDPRFLKMLKSQRAISGPDTNFTEVGKWPWGSCYAVARDSPYVLVGNGSLIQVLKWNARTGPPAIVSEYDLGFPASQIVTRDSLAYIIGGYAFVILDVKNPNRIQRLGGLDIPDILAGIDIVDSIAYVITLGGSLALINIRDNSSPRLISVVGVPNGLTTSLAVKDGHCYVGTLEAPLVHIYDATNPDSVKYAGFLNPGFVLAAAVKDTELILSVSWTRATIQFWSITSLDTPAYLNDLIVPNNLTLSDLTVSGSNLDASGTYGVFDIDLSDSAEPFVAAFHGFPYQNSSGGSHVRTAGGIIYATCDNGLAAYDALDTLRYLGFYPTGGAVVKIALRGKLASLASSLAGLWLLDISEPRTPRQIVNINNGGFTNGAIISRDDLIMYDQQAAGPLLGKGGVYIYNISDSTRPRLLSSFAVPPLGPSSQDGAVMCLDSNLLFLAQQQTADPVLSYLEIFDISDLQNPRQIVQLSEPFLLTQMAARSGTLYAGARDEGLYIFDYGLLPNFRQVSHIKRGNTETEFALALHDSLMFLDCLVQTGPDSLGFIETTHKILGYNINQSTMPDSLSSFLLPANSPPPLDIVISGDYLYSRMADSFSQAGIAGIDVSDPFKLNQKAFFTATEALSLAASDGFVYVGWSEMGILVIHNDLVPVAKPPDLHFPKAYSLEQNYPNPFNPNTTIKYDIPTPASVTLRVYDLLGREVATLEQGIKLAGRYSAEWVPRNAASGVYFYQLRAVPLNPKDPGFSSTKRMVLVR